MRNRLKVTRGALLCLAPVIVSVPPLCGQVAHQDLARAGWIRPREFGPAETSDRAPGRIAGRPQRPSHRITLVSRPGLRWAWWPLLSTQDKGLRTEFQDARSSSTDDFAKAIRHLGQPEVYATVALGTVATGLISGNAKITRAGGQDLLRHRARRGGLHPDQVRVGRRRPFSAADQYTFRRSSASRCVLAQRSHHDRVRPRHLGERRAALAPVTIACTRWRPASAGPG